MIADTIHDKLVDTSQTQQDAHAHEAQNFLRHLASLIATKLADGLIDPKLILSWVLTNLGAPGYLIGALVPVREAGALLPQLALSRRIEAARQRKWFWVAGSALQGVAAFGMALTAVLLSGAAAGWAILGLLGLLAVARSACSASHKDIMARTLAKGSRGTVSGTAGTISAGAVAGFAALLSLGIIPSELTPIAAAIAIAGALWLGAAVIFAGLPEPDAEPEQEDGDSLAALIRPLGEDTEFRHYVATRALMIATALAPPFLVLLGGQSETGGGLGNLGLLVLASSFAAILSSYIWGRLSDISSRKTLAFSGATAALVLGAAGLTGLTSGGLGAAWMVAGFVFAAQIAYEGARAGRKTHLTDMDSHGHKSLYTALSNTMIGVLLLAGGGFGLLADLVGAAWVLLVFAVMAAAGAASALTLHEVQQDGG